MSNKQKVRLPAYFTLYQRPTGPHLYYSPPGETGSCWMIEPNGGLRKTLELAKRWVSGELKQETSNDI